MLVFLNLEHLFRTCEVMKYAKQEGYHTLQSRGI